MASKAALAAQLTQTNNARKQRQGFGPEKTKLSPPTSFPSKNKLHLHRAAVSTPLLFQRHTVRGMKTSTEMLMSLWTVCGEDKSGRLSGETPLPGVSGRGVCGRKGPGRAVERSESRPGCRRDGGPDERGSDGDDGPRTGWRDRDCQGQLLTAASL